MSTFTVTVPATTANLGPGFDCLGAALRLYNHFTFTVLPETVEKKLTIRVKGAESAKVSESEDNLLYRSFLRVYDRLQLVPPPIEVEIDLGVPLSRGLGSSATAIVGGLVGANRCAGDPFPVSVIRDLAIAIEGHPDNVVPSLLGHCQLSVGDYTNWQICQVPWDENIIPVVVIPDFELSTEKARAVLPKEISRQDAIFNVSRLGLLLRALETGDGDRLRVALDDKIHQPYRKSLIPGYDAVHEAAQNAGAFGMVISGAGPTLLALSSPESASSVAAAMEKAWFNEGVTAKGLILSLDTSGA
ncbi:homoserine kinase, partial [Pannus brasiliensis CCIBt3594]